MYTSPVLMVLIRWAQLRTLNVPVFGTATHKAQLLPTLRLVEADCHPRTRGYLASYAQNPPGFKGSSSQTYMAHGNLVPKKAMGKTYLPTKITQRQT
jgi:hypothetical protein